MVDIVSRGSHWISELVTAVKGYLHMDRATEQTVDIHEGIEGTLLILGHRLKDVSVTREYDRALPKVHVFGNTLNQVWTNILDNAIDAVQEKDASPSGPGAMGTRSPSRSRTTAPVSTRRTSPV